MPIRTDADAVKAVLAPGGDYDLKRSPSLTPFMTVAAKFVDRLVVAAAEGGYTLEADDPELIERYLAAWAYCNSDRIYTSRSTQGASGSFSLPQAEAGLNSNPYGTMAKMLDPTGLLPAIVSAVDTIYCGGDWLGKPTSQQTNYEDR